jgi:hypothetical protein
VTECSPSSTSVLHKQWTKLENEHHGLAIAICAARAKKADVALMRKRQETLLREIGSLVAKILNAPATTIEDFLALLDVALEHELDLACQMALYGPADYPIITRLLRVLARETPGFEFNSLRRWLSVPGQFEQVMGPSYGNSSRRKRMIARQAKPRESSGSIVTSINRAPLGGDRPPVSATGASPRHGIPQRSVGREDENLIHCQPSVIKPSSRRRENVSQRKHRR